MKKILYTFLLFFILLSFQAEAQITFRGCTFFFSPQDYTLTNIGTTNDGGTIRNTYQNSPPLSCGGLGACQLIMIWSITNNRWELQGSNGSTNFGAFYYNTSASVPNPPDLNLGTWEENTALTTGSCGGDGSASIITLSGDVQSTLGGGLPVELMSFEATRKSKNDILLTWTTASEKDNAGFEVQVSTDLEKFENIAFIKGKGSSSSLQHYNYTTTQKSSIYFRLKQVDFDGSFSYSPIRFVAGTNDIHKEVVVYPNPTSGKIFFKNIAKETRLKILVFNSKGEKISNLEGKKIQVENQLSVLLESIDAGQYLMYISVYQKSFYHKILKY